MRPKRALVILASPKTWTHLAKLRLVVIIQDC